MIEIDKIGKKPEQTLTFLTDVNREAEGRIASRIIIEETNLALKNMPLGGEDGLDQVLGYIPMVKEGFALNLRGEDVPKDEVRKLFEITKPQSLAEFMPELGFKLRAFVIKDDPRLSFYRHALAVLTILSGLSTVDSHQLGIAVEGTSLWPVSLDKEKIWYGLSEIEDTTRKIILDRRNLVRREAEFKALHFFAAGKMLAEKLR